MRHAARTDANQADIIAALQKAGAYVWVIGLPVDLLVGIRGETYLLEVKSSDKRYIAPLTSLQRRFMSEWDGGAVCIVTTPDEALRAIGVL